MKIRTIAILAALCGFATTPVLLAQAEKAHDHKHEKKEDGPNGGRLITSVDPHFEFFVTAERKVKITFVGEDKKAIAPAEQAITAVGGDRANPTKLTFTKEGDALISDKALPDAKEQPIVLQIKTTKDAKTVTEKFNVNLAECPECKHKEYACVCEHDHEH